MECQFSDFNGRCQFWDGEATQFAHIIKACDSEGYCLVEDDPDPERSCKDYIER